MEQDLPPKVRKSRRPFADHVERLHGGIFPNLVNFLRKGHKSTHDKRTLIYAHDVWIGDCCNNTFTTRYFAARAPYGEARNFAGPDFASALHEWPENVTCRVVLSTCRSIFDVNESYIDEIAFSCDLSPAMLASHFDLLGKRHQRFGDEVLQLPSEKDYLQLQNIRDMTMTATVRKKSFGHLVVILCMGLGASLSGVPFPFLGGLQPHLDHGLAQDGVPLDILYSFVRSMVLQAETVRRLLVSSFEAKIEKSKVNLLEAQMQRDALVYSHTSLTEYVRHQSDVAGGYSAKLATLESEYLRAISQISTMISDQQGFVQHAFALKSIEEASRGIQQAESVRRLTIIAFVFIPLNFATSFFGMNLKQLNSGSLSIGYFFLLAVLTGLVAYLLSATVRPLESLWKAHHLKVSMAAQEDWRVTDKGDMVRFWIGWHWKALLGRQRPASSAEPH